MTFRFFCYFCQFSQRPEIKGVIIIVHTISIACSFSRSFALFRMQRSGHGSPATSPSKLIQVEVNTRFLPPTISHAKRQWRYFWFPLPKQRHKKRVLVTSTKLPLHATLFKMRNKWYFNSPCRGQPPATVNAASSIMMRMKPTSTSPEVNPQFQIASRTRFSRFRHFLASGRTNCQRNSVTFEGYQCLEFQF